MNFETIKLGFQSYLEELKDNSNKDYKTDNTNVSIFMYANEFKDYLSDELNCDTSVFSKSINDILKMDIVNGKLVDASEEDAVQDKQNVYSQEERPTQNDTTGQDINNPEAAASGEEEASVTDFLNELMNTDEVKSLIDVDESGELDDEEIGNFLNAIKGLDGNEEDISLNDVLEAINSINKGEFQLKPDEIEIQSDPEIDEADVVNNTPPITTNRIPSSGGGNSGAMGNIQQPQGVQEKTLENMTKDELNSELSTAQSELKTKQDALSTTTEDYQDKLNELDEQYIKDIEEIDKEAAETIEADTKAIQEKEAEISEKDKEIADQENTVNDCQSAYDNAVSTRESLEQSLSSLEAADTSNMDSDAKSDLSSKIASVKSQIEQATKAEKEAETALKEAKEKLDALNKEKEELETGEGGLEELKQTLADHEEELINNNPELKQIVENYHTTRDSLETEKETAITNAKTEIQEAQKYVNEVKAAITNADNKEKEQENSINEYNAEAGQKLAQNALNVRGTTGYCLAGVNDTLKKTYGMALSFPSAYMAADALRGKTPGYEGLASKFKEVQVDRADLPNLPAGAIVVWDNNANGGGSNVSAAGRKHGHISIALGNGKESSDHIQNQTYNRDANYSVFLPIA